MDLSDVTRALERIANELHKPFANMDADRRHREMLNIQNQHHNAMLSLQNKHHQEILDLQKDFNEKSLSKQEKLSSWTKWLAIATIILVISTTILNSWSTWNTKKSIDLQSNLYSPQVTVQITDGNLPWQELGYEYEYNVWPKYWNETSYLMPIQVRIINHGLVPFQLYWIGYEGNCGKGNRGLVRTPEKVVAQVGEELNYTDEIYLSFGSKIQDKLPCYINFTIIGINFKEIKKITLVKDRV